MNNSSDIININKSLYNGVISKINTSASSMGSISSSINLALKCLTSELAPLVSDDGCYLNATSISNELKLITSKINAALTLYEQCDEELGTELLDFDFFVNNIFNIDNYKNNAEKINYTVEERQEMINNLLTTYKDILNQLKEDYASKYERGIPLTEEEYRYFSNFINKYDPFSTKNPFEENPLLHFVTFLNQNMDADKDLYYIYVDFLEEIYGVSVGNLGNELLGPKMKEFVEFLDDKLLDSRIMKQEIADLEGKVYNIEQVAKLFPFTSLAENEDFTGLFNRENLTSDPIISDIISYLSDDDLAIYTYLSNHSDSSKLAEFISAMEDTINNRKGFSEAEDTIEKWIEDDKLNLADVLSALGDGTWDGAVKFFNGVKNFFAPDGIRTALEYKQYYLAQLLTQEYDQKRIDELWNNNEISKDNYEMLSTMANLYNELKPAEYRDYASIISTNFIHDTYKMGNSIGTLLPSIAFGKLGAVLAGPLGTTGLANTFLINGGLGTVAMGLSSAGNSINGALISGNGLIDSYLYGITSGLSTAALQKLLGGIPVLSNMSNNVLTNMAKEMGKSATGSFFDAGLRSIILNEPMDLTQLGPQALNQAIQGLILSGLMQGGQAAFKYADEVITWGKGELNYWLDKSLDESFNFSLEILDLDNLSDVSDLLNRVDSLDIDSLDKDNIPAALYNAFFDNNKKNNNEALYIADAFDTLLGSGSTEAENLAKLLLELKVIDPNFNFSNTSDGSYYVNGKIYISDAAIKNNNYSHLFHEIGHHLFETLLNGEVPDDFNAILEDILTSEGLDDRLKEIKTNINIYDTKAIQQMYLEFDNWLSSMNVTESEFTDQWAKRLENFPQDELEKLIKPMIGNGFDDNIILDTLSNPSPEVFQKVAEFKVKTLKIERLLDVYNKYFPTLFTLEDMISGVFIDHELNPVNPTNHDKTYYALRPPNTKFHEQIANYVYLKTVSGNLESLAPTFSPEYIGLLENTYNNIIKEGNSLWEMIRY